MTIAEFIRRLGERQVTLSIEDGKLRYRGPREALGDAVLAEIRDRKPDLIAYLGRAPEPPRRLSDGEPAALSPGQEALWFLYELDRSNLAYNTLFAGRLRQDLDIDLMRAALQALTDRHDGLRSRFHTAAGTPLRQVVPVQSPALEVTDVSGWSPGDVEAAIAERGDRPFDLEAAPPVRWHLLRAQPGGDAPAPVLVLVAHHSVVDFRSMEILLRDLSALYRAAHDGVPAELPPLPWSYDDHVAWSRDWIRSAAGARARDYWLHALGGELPVLAVPTDMPRPPRQTFAGATLVEELDGDLTAAVRAAAGRLQVTPYVLLLGVFGLLLHRYSGQREVLVGSPVLGRSRPETNDLVGFFVNPVVLRLRFAEGLTGTDYLAGLRETVLAALEHQDYPFPALVEHLQPQRDGSRSPVFQMAFVYERERGVPLDEQGLLDGMTAGGQRGAVFDLTLTVLERADGLRLTWDYATALFRPDTIARMSGHFRVLLDTLLAAPDRPLASLRLVQAAEAARLQDWNRTDAPLPSARNLPGMVAAQVARQPEAIAVDTGERQLTYAALDAAACRLAERLQGLGVKPNAAVALALPRSPEQLIAVLGVLRAGGACLPLDLQDPPERLAFVLDTARAEVVLTDRAGADILPSTGAAIVVLSADDPLPTTGGTSVLPCPAGPDDLAYLLFTSGSTGRPKGVAMPHRPMLNLMAWHAREPGLDRPARTLQYTALTFDVAFQEIFSTWCAGGTLVPVDEACRRDGRALLRWIAAQRVERLFMPFVALQHLAESVGAEGALPACLRDIVTAGEQLRTTPAIRAAFARSCCRLHNHYGPTESHVVTAFRLPVEVAEWEDLPPIGRPIANVRIHLLDESGQQVPVGLRGELCIAGAMLAQGYLARPDLTGERFATHPDHGRIYRTGDFARWRPDGLLDYLGRGDDQVKVRGVRVELGEIEAVLSAHPAVGAAAAVVRGSGADARLAAYVAAAETGRNGAALRAELRDHLRAHLPAPLIPASVTLLDRLPQTSSGKLDRRALPEPATDDRSETLLPRDQDEALLAGLWADLLGLARVGPDANFFDLGGHSLIAMRLIARIRDSFGIDLPLSALFEQPTVAGLAEWMRQQRRGEHPPPISPLPAHRPAPLSFAQRRLWFLEQLEGPSATYSMPATIELRGALDIGALRQAGCRLVARQPVLRSRFPRVAGDPQARLLDTYDPLNVTDLSHLGAAERETEALRLSRSHATQPFDLAEGPLFRLHLLRLDGETHWLLFNMHHIVSDGWSLDVLARDLTALYRAAADGGAANLPALPVSYGDWAAWQNDWLRGATLDRQLAFWIAELYGAPKQLDLPGDRPPPATRSYRGGFWEHRLDDTTTQQLRAFNRARGATDFMTLIAALGLLLARYSGQTDLLIGSPVANRHHRECENLIGLFVNTIVLRWRQDGAADFAALVDETRRRCLRAYDNQDLLFEVLVEHLQPERSLTRSPLFQVMFAMQNTPSVRLAPGGTAARRLAPPITVAKFDLTLYVAPVGEGLVTRWEYNSDIFDEGRIARLAGHFERILRDALAHPDRPLGRLELVTGPERRQLAGWRDGPARDSVWDTLVAGFEAQAERRPRATALAGPGCALDFDTVNRRANRLAHYLQRRGVSPGSVVGLCLQPGPEAVVALLGIVKAGAAYLPLDPAYPVERLAAMLATADAALVLSESGLADLLPAQAATCLLDRAADAIAGESDRNLPDRPAPDDLLYVIFTSGSTGQPKGAGVRHRGFANLLQWYCRTLDLGPGDRGLLVSALGFDLTQKNLFAPLVTGAALHFPATGSVYDPDALRDAIAANAITWINCTPSAFYALAAGGDEPAALASLRWVVLGGEPIQTDRLRPWLQGPHCRATVLNSYGPTECTDVAVAGPLDPASGEPGVPLGRPIDNVRILVVDPEGQPQPVGLPGELLIGGAGVGTGYVGQPDLTAGRFVDLVVDGHRQRYYRTGDIACWRADGRLDYLGRRDQQIKLRGFRIELGEIEAALRAQPFVEDAAAIVQQSGASEQLVGYLVGDGRQLDLEAVRPALERRLPGYMVPDSLIRLDRLPLTPNGKLDRRALPRQAVAPREAEPPRGPTEVVLAGIWRGLLGRESIDRNAGFFSLGGHSLLAVQLVARVAEVFDTELSLRTLFEAPSFAAVAAAIDAGRDRQGPALAPLPPGSAPEPSIAQQRLLALSRLHGTGTADTISAILDLRGPLDRDALRHALSALVQRHDSLRLCFASGDGRVTARLLPPYDPLTETDLGHLPEAAALDAADSLAAARKAAPFDLAQGPLFRLHLVTLGPQRHRLLFDMHHVIGDGRSIDLLIADLSTLYAARRRGAAPALPDLPLQYTDYAAWQRRCLEGGVLARQLAFWRARLAGAPALTSLPTDHRRPAVRIHEAGGVPLPVDAALARDLRELARNRDATLFMVLLAAYNLLLFRCGGMRDLCVGVPVSTRSDRRLEAVVGLFLNTLVLRSRVPEDGSFAAFLAEVRQTTLAAFAHQDLPFEHLVDDLRP
ncbi:MAG: amino acid adenylation domain-containing protein, partial [Sneathiellaceae bacterium]